jgi:hypothetical protein
VLDRLLLSKSALSAIRQWNDNPKEMEFVLIFLSLCQENENATCRIDAGQKDRYHAFIQQ